MRIEISQFQPRGLEFLLQNFEFLRILKKKAIIMNTLSYLSGAIKTIRRK